MASDSSRAGRYVKQRTGYSAFIPAPLPPDPPVELDGALQSLLSRADQAVGRLDGVIQTVPNPDFFVYMYVRREAVLSSQIEGTQSTLEDLLAAELENQPAWRQLPQDVEEVVNYVRAMNYGLASVNALPLSLRLITEIHRELLTGVRGSHRLPGEFRRSQNWIGPEGATLATATFVPPPVHEMKEALDNFERFLHDDRLPALVHVGLAHAQFETIHPFLDGNGRVGRLLISFLLVHRRVLHRPLLYLSVYLRRRRAEYYDRLMAIRESGDWEGWLRFFLAGVAETAEEAAVTARSILDLRERHRQLIQDRVPGVHGLRLLDVLFERPLVQVNLIRNQLGIAFVTANKLVDQLADLEVLEEITGRRRDRVFSYAPFLRLFHDDAAGGDAGEVHETESEGEPEPVHGGDDDVKG
ncbi:MAG: Fic family protein [Gaiellales bacterium]